MHFLILANDATDDGALERRMAARDAHIKLISAYKAKGHMLIGAARLNDEGKMIGSVLIVDFPSREGVDKWLAEEPYVTNKVWDDITIEPCAIGPSFLKG